MNKVTLIGRLTKDPETRQSQTGTAVCSFTLAVNRQFKKDGEERQADFIMCKAFGKTANHIAKYFAKGQQVAVCGRIQTGSYEKEGQKVYTTDIIVDEVYFADGKKDQSQSTDSQVNMEQLQQDGEDMLPF